MEASKLLAELIQGRELAKQLQKHLDPSTPNETREFLIQKILSTYNNLLHMTNSPCKSSFQMNPNYSHQISFHGGSPCSASDLDNRARSSKRRKTLPKWVKAVKVRAKEGEERDLCDGYSWRKYGQKAILGAKFPRSYYRCTHRHTRGCVSTKQVQKSTDDNTLFHVIYRGHHTCSVHINDPLTNPNPPPLTSGPQQALKPNPIFAYFNPQQEVDMSPQHDIIQNHHTPGNGFPEFKVETLDMDNICSTLLGGLLSTSPMTSSSSHLLMRNANGNDMWTHVSDFNNKHSWSGSDSSFRGFEFTLDEFGIEPNFPFNEPDRVMLG